jgi:hypothetical protein
MHAVTCKPACQYELRCPMTAPPALRCTPTTRNTHCTSSRCNVHREKQHAAQAHARTNLIVSEDTSPLPPGQYQAKKHCRPPQQFTHTCCCAAHQPPLACTRSVQADTSCQHSKESYGQSMQASRSHASDTPANTVLDRLRQSCTVLTVPVHTQRHPAKTVPARALHWQPYGAVQTRAKPRGAHWDAPKGACRHASTEHGQVLIQHDFTAALGHEYTQNNLIAAAMHAPPPTSQPQLSTSATKTPHADQQVSASTSKSLPQQTTPSARNKRGMWL